MRRSAPARTDVAVDEGLRAYMLRVYNYMAAGVSPHRYRCLRLTFVTAGDGGRGPTGRAARLLPSSVS